MKRLHFVSAGLEAESLFCQLHVKGSAIFCFQLSEGEGKRQFPVWNNDVTTAGRRVKLVQRVKKNLLLM